MNTYGKRLRLTTFGESHGTAIGGVIDGYPAGVRIDFEELRRAMAERRPGQPGATQRQEDDIPEFLSGISPDGVSLGTPIGFLIRNNDTRSRDYGELAHAFRPGHADFTYQQKYGIRDHRGGGRASARETACRVVGGALASQWLSTRGVRIQAFLASVGQVEIPDILELLAANPSLAETYAPDPQVQGAMMEEIERARKDGDSIGGSVVGIITGLPAGVGNPVYDKLSARVAGAMIGINAAKGFEIGGGSGLSSARGSSVLDNFEVTDGEVRTTTNYSGGILGGISNGMPVVVRVWFKPTPTIGREVALLREDGQTVTTTVPGRHDPCVALRAVPVVKAMAALTVADFLL